MSSTRYLEQKDRPFYATEICHFCKYDLIADKDNRLIGEYWDLQTGCPVCYRSFVE